MALTRDKGADACFDPIGGELSDAALSSLGWGGRLLLVGFVGGVQQIPANRLLVKNRSALGCSLRYYLRVTDIDAQRMVIRIEQGKGRKDRYVMLSPHLHRVLQAYWRVRRPRPLLFPGPTGRPSHVRASNAAAVDVLPRTIARGLVRYTPLRGDD